MISEPYRNKLGKLVRDVNDIPIIQVEENNQYDVKFNELLNQQRLDMVSQPTLNEGE
jgi:hypothetical protein